MDEILSIYKKYNRPGAQKLLQLAKAEGIQASSKDIKEFLSGRTEEQQLKESRNTKQSHGHIVSYNPFNRLQLDIFVLKKYEGSNNGYGYILCIIDIFSRKVWCYPMKSKSLSDTTPAIKKFFSTSGLHEFNSKALVIIMSDSDSAFKGDNRSEDQNFQKILSDNNAVLEPVKLNDHHELTFASAVQPGGSRFGTALGNRTPYHPQTESSRGGRSEPTPLGSSVLHEVGQLDPDIERLRAPHPMVMCRVTLRGWCAVNVRQEGKGGQAGKRVLAAELDARWQLEELVDGPVRVAARGACRWPRPRSCRTS